MQHNAAVLHHWLREWLVPPTQSLLLVRIGICNLARVPAIARLLFTQDTVGYLTSTSCSGKPDVQFHVHPRDGRYILPVKHQDCSYWAEIPNQARQLRGECAYI